MRDVLAIDPGTTHSAYCLYDMDRSEIWESAKVDNFELRQMMLDGRLPYDIAVIEMIACYGMAVGKSVFETCVWIGRYNEILQANAEVKMMFRREVKVNLCNSNKAKDGNVRQALIDRFPATGGGRIPQIGTKAKQGPLYGFAGDMWAALGVAVTFQDQQRGVA